MLVLISLLVPFLGLFFILLIIGVVETPWRVGERYKYLIATIPALHATVSIASEALWSTVFELIGPGHETPFAHGFIYTTVVMNGILEFLALLALAVLCGLLSRRILLRPARWLVVAPLWALVGLGLMSAAALGSDFLQDTLNNDAFRRMTPDDYHEMIDPGFPGDYNPLAILDNPSALDGYGWWRMTLTESVFICLIAFTAAFVLRNSARSRPIAAVAVPAAVFLTLMLYALWAAPWAFIVDYDNFI